MITLILVILAIILSGYCKAVADTLQHHFASSTFSSKNELFWNPDVSWKNKYKNGDSTQGRKYNKMFDGFTDAWHIYNNSAFYLLITGIALSSISIHITNIPALNIFIKMVIGITLHMQVFNLFYTHIFKKKV